jgi:hypothetical protein
LEDIAREDERDDVEEHGGQVRHFIGFVHVCGVRGKVRKANFFCLNFTPRVQKHVFF